MSSVAVIFEEHDYIGLSEVSTHEQTSDKAKITAAFTEINNSNINTNIINFKATELRLGLPGSESPHEDVFTCKVGKNKSLVSGAKRGFSDAINGGSNKWGLSENGGFEITCVKNNVGDNDCDKKLQSLPVSVEGNSAGVTSSKAQVVGWPPIRSFRKNSMANNTLKNEDNKDSKTDSGCLFVKVSMDGAPYLRKVNLGTFGGYVELSTALEKMFRGFTMVDFKKGRLMDNLRHSEYVLTYEDKDADWMLVGDVPWNMFKISCRRMRIMKSSDAVGLASKASEE